jgi:hypothetical protein
MDGAYTALTGYKFQFDKTIIEVFNNPAKTIQIEQVQDLGYDDYNIQVKYHNTDYTAPQQKSKIKEPMVQLIEQFKTDKSKKYVLYIYLKGIAPSTRIFADTAELETIIGTKTTFTTKEKSDFIKQFTLIHAIDFDTQYNELILSIKSNYCRSIEEAEIYYSIISNYLLDIVTKNPPAKIALRLVSKNDIDDLIQNGKKLIFNAAFADMLGEEKYFKHLKKLFFKQGINNEPHERFFVIETPPGTPTSILKEMVSIIKIKWSKNKTKAIPDTDRFAPYIFFRGIPKQELAILKKALEADGCLIKDGYNFLDADFSITSIREKPTYANKIFFKIINKKEELDLILDATTQTKEVYQFYPDQPLPITNSDKNVLIQIKQLANLKQIL